MSEIIEICHGFNVVIDNDDSNCLMLLDVPPTRRWLGKEEVEKLLQICVNVLDCKQLLYQYFNIDGGWHIIGNCDCQRNLTVKQHCYQCKSLLHVQATWHGVVMVCDQCHELGQVYKSVEPLSNDDLDGLWENHNDRLV